MSIFSKIREWFTGGSKKSSSSSSTSRRKAVRRASRTTDYGWRNYGSPSKPIETYEQRIKREANERKQKQQKITNSLAQITDAKSAGKAANLVNSNTVSGIQRAQSKLESKVKAVPPEARSKQAQILKSRSDATKALAKIDAKTKSAESKLNNLDKKVVNNAKAEQARFNRATNNRYNANTGNKRHDAQARLRIKSGEYQSDPAVEKYEVKYHPKRTSFTRGALSGVTFGGSELVAKKSKKRQQTGAEKYYQEHKRGGYEFAGDLTGSLLGFGLTSEGAVKAVGKVAPSLINPTEKTIAKYAGKKLVQRAAKREMRRAVEAGLVKEGSEELLERLIRDRARRIAVGVGKDRAINTTTGLLASGLHSAADAEDAGDFAKQMAVNVPLNYALGGALTVAPELRVGRGFLGWRGGLRDEAASVASQYADDIARAARQATPPQTLDDAVERAAVEAVEAREAVGQADEAIRPQSVNNPVGSEYVAMSDAERQAEYNRLTEEYNALERKVGRATTPTREAGEDFPRLNELDERLTILEREFGVGGESRAKPIKRQGDGKTFEYKTKPLKKKEAGSSTAKSVDRDALRKELRNNREEIERIQQEILDEHGEFNPNWGKLSAEERASLAAKKNRLKELTARNDAIGKELSESVRESASGAKKEFGKSKREELDAVETEYKNLRRSLKSDQKKISEGKEVDIAALEAKEKRLAEIEDRRDALRRELGTQTKPRKTRSDAGKPKPKTPAADAVEGAKQAEPRPLPKYEDIDLSKGLTEDERTVVSSKLNELDAERNKLIATDEGNPRVEELGAEISNIKRALGREAGEPARFADLEAHKAEQAARAAAEKAERNANAKPLKAKKLEGKAPAKEPTVKKAPPKLEKKRITEAERRRERAVARAGETFAGYDKELRKATEGAKGVRKSTKTFLDLSDTATIEKYTKQAGKALEDIEKSIASDDPAFVYNVSTREVRDKLVQNGLSNASKSPEAVLSRLEQKVALNEHITEQDVADMIGVKTLLHQLGQPATAKQNELFARVEMDVLTERAQGLKSISLMLRENDPLYRKRYLTKDFNKFREAVCDERSWDSISASLDKQHKTKGYLDSKLKELAEMTGGENEEAFRKKYVELQKEIWQHSKPTPWELFNLLRHTAMLGAFKTSDNNLIGNFAQSSMWEASDRMDALFEAWLSKTKAGKDMTRTTTFAVKDGNLRTFMNQLRSGELAEAFEEAGAKPRQYADTKLGQLLENARAEDVGDAMGTSKFGFKADKGWKYQYDSKLKNIAVKTIQAPAKAVGYMLSEPDSWFVERNYRKALARYLEANKITTADAWESNPELVKKARDYAKDVALENTYKKNSRFVSMLEQQRAKGYKKGAKWYDVLKTIGLDAELPYLRVPYNLIVNNIKYSPVGLLRSAAKASKAMHAGDVEALTRETKELSKALTGTGMMLAGFLMNCDDQMDDNSNGLIRKADEHLKEYGVRDNSLKIGTHNYNLANFGIGTVQFLMGSGVADVLNANGGAPSDFLDKTEAVIASFGTIFDVVSEMSIMENGLAVFDAISNGGDYDMELSERLHNMTAKIVGDYVGQPIPAPMRAAAKSFTSSDLDTGVKKGESTTRGQRTIQRNFNNVVNSIPIVNEKVLPHKVDRHGNYVNERTTTREKLKALNNNLNNPFSPREVRIPEADKIELSIKTSKGKPYQPQGYDQDREYRAKIGQGKHAEYIDLKPKEREQAAHSLKGSGKDMAYKLTYSSHAWFGDSHGERAQEILKNTPENEEEARAYLYSLPEFQKLDNTQKLAFVKDLYDKRLGRGRTANHEVYVNIKGGDEGDFEYQNDLNYNYQDKYENSIAATGMTKGQWANVIKSAQYESHKYKDGKNVDTIQAYGLKKALLEDESLSTEQRIAAYQTIRGKRNMFGWYDWDGKTLKGYRRGRRYRRWRRWRRYGYSKKAKVPTPKTIKSNQFVKGEALGNTTKSSSTTKSSAKTTPPTLKRVEAKIDLPTVKTTTKKR